MLGLGLGLSLSLLGGKVGPSISLSALSVAEAAINLDVVGTASISGDVVGIPQYSLTDASGTFVIDINTGVYTVTDNTDLATQAYFDVTFEVAGVTPVVPARSVRIWVVATKAVLDMIASSDTGASSTDNITSNTQPTFDFTATLYEGDIVKFYKAGVLFSSHTVTAGEAASRQIDLDDALTDGSFTFTATISRGGYESDASTDINPLVIDTTAPTISGALAITSTPAVGDTYDTGEAIQITITFTENVLVTGTPQLTIDVGGTNEIAAYASGSGTTALVFSYTVQAGDADANGVSIAANSLAQAGGSTIKDTAGNNATLTHAELADQTSHKVDATVSYTPQGVTFSATAYATRTSALTGVADGKSGLASFWFKNANAGGTFRRLFTIISAGLKFGIYISGSANKVILLGANTGGATVLAANVSALTCVSMADWAHVLMSWNLAAARVEIYANDASDITGVTATNDTIDYTTTANTIGADNTGASPWGASVADFQVWFNVDRPLSTEANRRLFIDASGNPVDPATAAATLGTAHILQSGASSGWETNDGSGGGFTLATGTITDAADNPP